MARTVDETRNQVKMRLARRLSGAGSVLLATLAMTTTPAAARPQPVQREPLVEREQIRDRLGLGAPRGVRPALPDGHAFWGNWTNGGPSVGWNNWPNWNNWSDWPDFPNVWNDWSKWADWGNV